MQDITETYHSQYQIDSVAPQALKAYDEIAGVLKDNFRPRNAMDVGCGGGALIQGLRNHNVDAYGIEGSSHAVALMPDRIEHHDLRTPYPKKTIMFGGYDLVTSFDVGEHIEIGFHDVFCDTIRSLMGNRGFLVFGAAGEGQDGLGHVSCRTMLHWVALFEKRGFKLQADWSEKVRFQIREREGTNFIWWVDKNLMVFTYEGRV